MMTADVTTDEAWQFLSRHEGPSPMGVVGWSWTCFGYLRGELKAAASGASQSEAERACRELIARKYIGKRQQKWKG